VFEFVERTLLEVLESRHKGLEPEEVLVESTSALQAATFLQGRCMQALLFYYCMFAITFPWLQHLLLLLLVAGTTVHLPTGEGS
jgi:hypothetical protein